MRNDRSARLAFLSLAASTLVLAGCTTRPNPALRAASFDVGRDANGDPCRATRTYDDETLKGDFDAAFVITCRSVTASRSVGTIRSVVEGSGTSQAVEAMLACGAPAEARVGMLNAQARRCYDSFLRSEAVVIATSSADRTIIGSAAPAVIQPLERGILALAGVPVAVATDSNPGTCLTESMPAVAAHACLDSSRQPREGQGERPGARSRGRCECLGFGRGGSIGAALSHGDDGEYGGIGSVPPSLFRVSAASGA